VILTGRRDPGDPDVALIAWRADGFVPQSWVLKRITPIDEEIETGTVASGKTSTSLDNGYDTIYRFQMTMSDGKTSIISNVVVIAPEPPPPTPRARVDIKKIDSGFIVMSNNGEKLPNSYQFTISTNYGNRTGKSPWTPEDYLLEDLIVKSKMRGLKVIHIAENYCQFEVTDSDFYAEWRGFDELRDLVVTAMEGK
jgi:hypothetical protein